MCNLILVDRFKKLQRMYRLTEQDGHGRIIQVQYVL